MTSNVQEKPEEFLIGELTMEHVFRAKGLTNLSDLQAVMDAVEAALALAMTNNAKT